MTNLQLCVGRLADTPYHFPKIEKDIYSVEELCYLLMQNAFLLDADTFELPLADWLKEACALPKLAEPLADMIRRHCSAESVVSLILRYVCYCDEEEIRDVEETLRDNAGLHLYEKKCKQADYLMNSHLYQMAFQEYDEVLAMLPVTDTERKAHILHNKGVMFARLFAFDEAAELFEESNRLHENKETYQCMLAAKRMSMTDKEYIDYIASNKDAYNDSLLLEQRMNEVSELYALSADHHLLHTLQVYKAESKMNRYYEEIEQLLAQIRESYKSTYASDHVSAEERTTHAVVGEE